MASGIQSSNMEKNRFVWIEGKSVYSLTDIQIKMFDNRLMWRVRERCPELCD